MWVVLSSNARSDLREIARFIARRDKTRARSFVGELQAAARELGSRPFAFALVPRFASHGIRKRLYEAYVIFYRIDEDRVIVLNIVHGARDLNVVLGLSDDDE